MEISITLPDCSGFLIERVFCAVIYFAFGCVVAMDRANVDTDQIIPKQFLKRIERTGFGQFLFNDWRLSGRRVAEPTVRTQSS